MNINGYASRYSVPNTKSVTSNTNNNAVADTEFASKLYSTVTEEASATNVSEASSQNVGISFSDLMNSQYARNKIPTINQIISSKSPVDGELYRVYFTNDRISCNHADGKRAWEVEINDEQQAEMIKEFFEGYTPNDNWTNNEYYSGDNIGMAVLKTFWLDLFKQ